MMRAVENSRGEPKAKVASNSYTSQQLKHSFDVLLS